MAIAKTTCLGMSVDAAPGMVDVPVKDNSVPHGAGAVGPPSTDQAPNQLITSVSAGAGLTIMVVGAGGLLVDVALLKNSVPFMAYAKRMTMEQPNHNITPIYAKAKPRFIATNYFKVRLAKKICLCVFQF